MAKKKATKKPAAKKPAAAARELERELETAEELVRRKLELKQALAFIGAMTKGSPAVFLEAHLGRGELPAPEEFEQPTPEGLRRCEALIDLISLQVETLETHLVTVERQTEMEFEPKPEPKP